MDHNHNLPLDNHTMELVQALLGHQDHQGEQAFDPSDIIKLPSMSLEQLIQIEENIAKEFHNLSQEYISARKSRLDYCIHHTQEQINLAQLNDQKWANIYTSEIHKIESLNRALENLILKQRSQSQEQNDLNDLLSKMESPLKLDDLFVKRKDDLPFAAYFKRMVTPYEDQLIAFKNEEKYQTELIENNVRRYKLIAWRQYRRDVLERRNKLIDETHEELTKLYEEYHGVRAEAAAAEDWKHYYRSVVPVTDMDPAGGPAEKRLRRDNVDSYYDVDSPFYKKNKVQLTKVRSDAIEAANTFSEEQSEYVIPQCEQATVKLASCSGLSQKEVDEDLKLLRQAQESKNVKSEASLLPSAPDDDKKEHAET